MSQPTNKREGNSNDDSGRSYHNSRHRYPRYPDYSPRYPYSYYPFRNEPNRHHSKRKRRKAPQKKEPSISPSQVPAQVPPRSPSPLHGSEEYTMRKIQEASDMIKKQLMLPPDEISSPKDNQPPKDDQPPKNVPESIPEASSTKDKEDRVPVINNTVMTRTKKPEQRYNVGEIHSKIMKHISNLSYGRKITLINSSSPGYDLAIQQIQRQKRLELSRALRDMCSNKTEQSSNYINSMIPDIGIEIDTLPLAVIQELSDTLDCDVNDLSNSNASDNVPVIKQEPDLDLSVVKHEPIDTEEIPEISHHDNDVTKTSEMMNFNNSQLDTESSIAIKDINSYMSSSRQDMNLSSMEINVVHKETDTTDLNCSVMVSNYTQTDFKQPSVLSQLQDEAQDVESFQDAIQFMFKIDQLVNNLTLLRQSVFQKLSCTTLADKKETDTRVLKRRKTEQLNRVTKLAKFQNRVTDSSETDNGTIERVCEENRDNQESKLVREGKVQDCDDRRPDCPPSGKRNKCLTRVGKDDSHNVETEFRFAEELDLGCIREKILVVKVYRNILLAGSESGRLFFIGLKDGATVHTVTVSCVPVTALCCDGDLIYVGSFDTRLRTYHFQTKDLIRTINISDSVQCFEKRWDFVFIGTTRGNLQRYSTKKRRIVFDDNISHSGVFVLKATLEGARRILLIGARNSPVCIRDAMSGLHMRTMSTISPTVYSLLLENSLVYCGTTSHDILVFSFHNGDLLHKYTATNCKGIGCMKIVGNLLYASCHNGNIYVYHTMKHEYVGSIQGPGGVILSMDVVDNIVIVGTMTCNFKSILIPEDILSMNQ